MDVSTDTHARTRWVKERMSRPSSSTTPSLASASPFVFGGGAFVSPAVDAHGQTCARRRKKKRERGQHHSPTHRKSGSGVA